MSINKKTFLGKVPVELGLKDAVHVAIVSLRAGQALSPGDSIKMNANGEAIWCNAKESFGVVDPYRTNKIPRGGYFWCQMNMDEIENVKHVWSHKHSFDKPTVEFKPNQYLEGYAKNLGVTYEVLMSTLEEYQPNEDRVAYTGTLSEDELEEAQDDLDSDIWYEWSRETGYEFDNIGTECCPEIEYPSRRIFKFIKEG